jgi:hypothetical protein
MGITGRKNIFKNLNNEVGNFIGIMWYQYNQNIQYVELSISLRIKLFIVIYGWLIVLYLWIILNFYGLP